MTEDFPILVGITGERALTPAQAALVRQRLVACFAAIDRQAPGTPKLLLTGGAAGSDLLAATILLEPGSAWACWKIAVLPAFAPALFLKTFPDVEPDSAAFGRLAFQDLIARAESGDKVSVHVLPRLAVTPGGVAVAPEQLDEEHPALDAALRRAHYEQVGQFIAETCMILIAVMPPDKQPALDQPNGGTARIVACRRAGRPDEIGAAVARRSCVVRDAWSPLVAPPAGAVWLIDPVAPAGAPPMTVLPPLTDRPVAAVYAGHPGRDMPPDHAPPEGPGLALWVHRRQRSAARHAPFLAPRAERVARARSQHAVRMLHGFHRRWRPRPGAARAATPADHIEALRSGLNSVQGRSKTLSGYAFMAVAGMFLAAVLSLELEWLGLYLLMLIGIGGVVTLAEELHWQPRAEDYRAVTEMLRVQKAWWSAGVSARVDRVHLQGAGADLLPIRDLARALIGLVALRFDFAPCLGACENWALVRPPGKLRDEAALVAGARPKDWVGDQYRYFAARLEDRERTASHRNCLTWVLFTLSFCLALMHWLEWPLPAIAAAHPTLAGLAGLTLAPLVIWRRLALHHIHHRWAARLLTVLACVLAAGGMDIAIRALAPSLAELSRLGFVMLSAVAGAVRFVTERLGLEAEALAYRDAREIFRRAEHALAAALDPETGLPRDAAACRALVVELGSVALRENQSWLEAHRERPLSPVVG